MLFEFTLFNCLTLVVLILTGWLMRARFTTSTDTNWPLFYYVALVFYVRAYEGDYNNYVILAAVIAALFLRFEFLGGVFLKFFRVVEFLALAYVLFRGFVLLIGR